jgi:peptide/nickel transport system substrate-binding protein
VLPMTAVGPPGIQVLRTSGGGHKPFCMLCDTTPFDNPDMRMAIKRS